MNTNLAKIKCSHLIIKNQGKKNRGKKKKKGKLKC